MKQKILTTLFLLAFAGPSFSANRFVNVNTGDDGYDGTSPVFISGNIGPLKSINGAILQSSLNDTITISEGIYEERLILDKALVLLGNNWGVNPLTQTRNPETILVPPSIMTGTSISGNSLIEIQSCCLKIDGLMIYGDNSFLNTALGKYGQQFEMSFGIGGTGNYNNLQITNLIISNFNIAGISLTSGSFSTNTNKIDFCKIKIGEQNSTGIDLNSNFYSDINFTTIDSTSRGIALTNYSDKNSLSFAITYTNLRSELSGITLNNFSGNTDLIAIQYNVINPLPGSVNFSGIELIDLTSRGRVDLMNNSIYEAQTGIFIKNNTNTFNIIYSENSIQNGNVGIFIDQSLISPDIALTFQNSQFSGMDSAAIISYSEGDLVSIELVDVTIDNAVNGLFLLGNSTVDPTNTQFNAINRYYFFLDSSQTGIQPSNNIDATKCFYNGILGNNLNKTQGFAVENKVRHVLDRPLLGWVLFSNTNLYVSNFDGNNLLTPALKVASNGWNIFTEDIESNEKVIVAKTINLFTHPKTSIGIIHMQGSNRVLYLHGKLALSEGLILTDGKIETTDSDSLIIYRNNYNTTLRAGNELSYINGPFFIRYINMPENYIIVDTLPVGLGNDYRPIYINATWPAGLFYFDMGIKSFIGKAPIFQLPSSINRISESRYWELTNPSNASTFTFNNVGFEYSNVSMDDLVKDTANIRVVFFDYVNAFNLGGLGSNAVHGHVISDAGSPGIGYYALGNEKGGMNTLSLTKPVANIQVLGYCSNDSIEFHATNSRSEMPIAFYTWRIQGPSVVSTPEVTESIKKKISTPGDYLITLIVTNMNGYEDTTTFDLTVESIPQVAYSALSPCFPTPIELLNKSVLPSFATIKETKWTVNSNDYFSNDLTFTPTASGKQSGFLKVTLNNGCYDSLAITFDSPLKPSITLTPHGNQTVCAGDSILVKVSKSAGIVQWNDSKTYDSLFLKSNVFKKATIYSSLQCYVSDSISLTVLSKPNVNAGIDRRTLPGKPIVLKGSSNEMVEWIPDTWLDDATIFNPVCRPLVSTKYVLRAYSTNGCEATDSMQVTVNSENDRTIPNLLTPDGDGHNDTWVLSSINDPQNCKVSVFTREGFLVFSTDSYKNDWDGKNGSNDLPDGYYLYVIEHQKEDKVYSGILNIIR